MRDFPFDFHGRMPQPNRKLVRDEDGMNEWVNGPKIKAPYLLHKQDMIFPKTSWRRKFKFLTLVPHSSHNNKYVNHLHLKG